MAHRVRPGGAGQVWFLPAFRWRPFPVLALWLALIFLLGGSARPDVQSLLVLRPLSVLILAYALAGMTGEQARAHRYLLGAGLAWLVLHLLQLVPLPPQLWQALPGRGVIMEIDRVAGIGDAWRPLSMSPHGTRNSAWALLAPLSVLVLGIRLDAAQRTHLLPLLIAIGLFSMVLAVLQLLGDPQGGLYFYEITNRGSAVGLFANRNHQGILLAALPPMLIVWAALRSRSHPGSARLSWTAAAVATALAIPIVFVTGSRAGLLGLLFGLVAAPAMLWAASGPFRPRGRALLVLALAALGMAAATVLLGRGLALERLIVSAEIDDLRFRALPTVLSMISLYGFWGTGFGSFTEVYELHEPAALLAPVYLNHAHNDWLELALTSGVPGIIIALAVTVIIFGKSLCSLRPAAGDEDEDAGNRLLVSLGLVIVLMLGFASLSDYPLRTPSLACLAVIAALWATGSPGPRGLPLQPNRAQTG